MILDIFAQRARSFEGKLQVELAQLSHLATRLVRGWTHLERQKGGIGLRGPGETQLETDRRLIAKRIRTLRARLEKLDRQRETRPPRPARDPRSDRRARRLHQRRQIDAVQFADGLRYLRGGSAVRHIGSDGRQVKLSGIGEVVLADTVGFVRALPHELVAAFRSTLQEARDADLLLHVVDASDPCATSESARCVRCCAALAPVRSASFRCSTRSIWAAETPRVLCRCRRHTRHRRGSRRSTGAGLPELREAIAQAVRPNQVRRTLHLAMLAAAVRSDLYRRNAVRAERQCDDGSWELDVELDLTEFAKLLGDPGVDLVEPATQGASSAWHSPTCERRVGC